QRLFDLALRQAEVEAVQLAAKERTRLLEEALRRAEQEASQRASKERQRLVEAARKQAEVEAAKLSVEERDRLLEEAHKRAEQEAAEGAAAERRRLIEEARKRAEQEASHLVATERRRLVEEARKEAEQEAAQLAVEMEQHLVEQARKSAEQEISRLAEQERAQLLDEARKKAETEAAMKSSRERQRLLEEARKKAEREAAPLAEEERGRLLEESLKHAEAEAAQFAEAELQRLLEEARKKAEREAARHAEKERKRLFAEERKRAKQEAQRQSAEMIAQPDLYGTRNLSGEAPQSDSGSGPSLDGAPVSGHRGFNLQVVIGGAAGLLILVAAITFYVTRDGGKTPAPDPRPSFKPDLVRVSGGVFKMGRDYGRQPDEDEAWAEQQRPAHEVTIGPFEIDRVEITNAEYGQFVRESGYQPPSDWTEGKPPAGQERWPVCNVSLNDARVFADWRSKRDGVTYRLPTEAQWEFAAKGQTSNRFPWGAEWMTGRANIGTNAPQPAGAYQQGASQFDVLDLIGNVGEWTSSPASPYPGNTRFTEKSCPGCYVVRGGSFASSPSGAFPISVTVRGFFDPTHKDPKIGFRLVR
ncbi:MAG: SUMF1/EgtB/PvdO family nonheme iron enzyme, partial [Blastocatellia bacterium]